MYSDKIFPRPFPLFVSFFTLFSALLRRLCPYFRRSSPFFLSAPPPPNPVLSFSPAAPTFRHCAGDCFPHLPVLCRRFLFRALLSPAALSLFCPFPFALSFFLSPAARLSCTVQAFASPTFLYCAGGCPVCQNFPVFFDGIDKKAGNVLLFFRQHQRGGQCLRHCPPKSFFKLSFLISHEKAKIALFAFSPCAIWMA